MLVVLVAASGNEAAMIARGRGGHASRVPPLQQRAVLVPLLPPADR